MCFKDFEQDVIVIADVKPIYDAIDSVHSIRSNHNNSDNNLKQFTNIYQYNVPQLLLNQEHSRCLPSTL
jgi:hypothetical protein